VIDLHYEARINRKNDEPCWVVVASSATEFDGLPAVIVHAVDITESKEALKTRDELSEIAQVQEEQLVHSTRLAELGEMAAQVAHELNQPLTGIRNFASNALYMLENEIGEPIEVTDNLKRIAEQVDRAARIINRMRQLARKTERQLGQIDINALISEMVEFLTPQLNLSGVNVTLDLMQGLPPLMGDRIRLEQVLLNLLTNARQAMEESHERRLAIRTFVNSSQLCPLTIEVRDTGIGFGPGVAEKLFRPFFTTKKPGQGTGLGLSISLSIIKDHKGTIEAHSEPGRGTTFVVRLPLATEYEGTKRAQEN
jgi:C4-dicarboxylate-specific signal transduction histidine kinase